MATSDRPSTNVGAPGGDPENDRPPVVDLAPVPGMIDVDGAGSVPESLGLAVRTTRGLAWFVCNAVLGKGLAFVAFAVLGMMLDEGDFRVYATAFAFGAFAQVFRDGGVIYLIPQRGEAEYPRLAGPVFWMALTFNLAVAGVMAIGAWPAAWFCHDARVAWVLWIMALAVPLNTPATMYTAVLQMRLRFDAASRIGMVSAVVRNVSIIGLALAGAGPLSFVIPVPLVALVEGVMGYAAVRDRVWLRRPAVALWGELFGAAKWLIVTVIANAGVNQGAYLALVAITPRGSTAVAVFFFAYQLVLQVDAVLNYAVGFVLLGAFSSIKNDASRQRAAAVRAARALALVATPATIGLAVVAAPFERLMWGGKWEEAVFAVQVIAMFCAWRIVFAVPAAAAQALGLWKYTAMLMIIAGAGTIAAVSVGAMLRPDADTAGIAMGLFMLLGLGSLYVEGMRKIGVPVRTAIGAVARCWLIGVIAAGLTVWLAHLLQGPLASLGRVTDGFGHRAGHWMSVWFDLEPQGAYKLEHNLANIARAAVEMLLLGTAFTKLFLVGLRLGAPGTVRDALSLAPRRLRPRLERLFVIRAA